MYSKMLFIWYSKHWHPQFICMNWPRHKKVSKILPAQILPLHLYFLFLIPPPLLIPLLLSLLSLTLSQLIDFLSFIIQQCQFSIGISVVSTPIEITSAIFYLSLNLKLYAFKKPSWFNQPPQSLTTTTLILLILLLLLFLSIIRHHIFTSTLKLLFLVLLPIFIQHWITIICLFITFPSILILITSTT